MKALQQNITRLEGADTQVLGVSMDSPFSNFAFAQQNGVSFPILGDWGGPVTSRYGLTQKFDIQGVPMEARTWLTKTQQSLAAPAPEALRGQGC